MNMHDIRRIRIVAGPTPVAYDFDEKTGELSVWLGDQAEMATKTAQRTAIEPGFTEWIMEETAD